MHKRFWIRQLFVRPITHAARKEPRRTRVGLGVEALEDRRLLSITVNNPTDTPIAGEIDLRQAIMLANTTAGAQTITFDPTVFNTPQTINLSGGQLELSDTTGTETITGPSAGVTVNAGGASRVFQVDANVTASISGLTITGGNSPTNGGGVYNSGSLALTNCTVSGNSANGDGGGVGNVGTAALTNCTVSGNTIGVFWGSGGGLLNNGSLTLTNCTVSGNSAGAFDGGIINYGLATLANTIVAGNTGQMTPLGEIGGGPDVGGVFVSQGNNLIGVTAFSSGWVGSDLTGTAAHPLNPLLAPLGNYGGPTQTMPLLPGSAAIDAGSNALIPSGVTTDQRGLPRIINGTVDIGAFESEGFTLRAVPGGSPQTSTIGTAFANPLAVIVTANNPIEPVNGGVVSFVAHPAANGASAILSTSVTVITGGEATVTAAPNNVDGSYQVVASANALSQAFNLTNTGRAYTGLVVNTTSDSLAPGAGLLSLREAISFANADRSGNTEITFDKHVFIQAQSINLTGGQLELSNTSEVETITAPAAGVTINAGAPSRVLQVDANVTASISGLTISAGKTVYAGGGVYNLGKVTLNSCTVTGNSASDGGGGVYNLGTATLTNCTVSDNSSNSLGINFLGSGGGVKNKGSLAMADCTVTGNISGHNGGGVYNLGTATLTNCTVSDNSNRTNFYDNYGGGVSNYNGTLKLANCTVTGNSAHSGGGVENAGTAALTDCTVSGNSASSFGQGGGGVLNYTYSTATLTNCTVSGNFTNGWGGGMENKGTAALISCSVRGNSASGGGGVFNLVGTATLDECTVNGNSSSGNGSFFNGNGGGILNVSTATLTNSTVSGNSTSGNGGGVFSVGRNAVSLNNCTVSGNSAGTNGGGLYNFISTATLTNCTISGNSAGNSGGGVFNAHGIPQRGFFTTATLTNCMVSGNSASTGGGISNQGTLNVSSSNIIKNMASSAGGGISTTGGTGTITDSTINANQVNSSATALGGGIDCESSALSLTNCTVNANQANGATAEGGGIYATDSTVSIQNSNVNGNKAIGLVLGEGGGIYSDNSLLTLLATSIVNGNKATTAYDNIFSGP